MIGKLIGRAAGEVFALPATIVAETEKAVKETAKTVEKRWDEAEGGGKK